MEDKMKVIEQDCNLLLRDAKDAAAMLINDNYKFNSQTIKKRGYSGQKMQIFARDGFVDRYSGKKLVIPGILKILSTYFPKDFPYQSHWKMSETHTAYWELIPTMDHISPIAAGGSDEEENWVTTSMINNAIKSNWTLDQLGWRLHEPGNMHDWDGLTNLFIYLVEKDMGLLNDTYIKTWYRLAQITIEGEKNAGR